MPTADAPSSAELLARLPTLPAVSRPFFGGQDHLAAAVADGDLAALEEMISGRFLDDMLATLRRELPELDGALAALGAGGLVMQARPSNTLNALTIPTRDGVVIVYNLGLFSMLHSVSVGVAMATVDEAAAADWLADLVDWMTSRAREPRTWHGGGTPRLDEEVASLATNIASRAQWFALTHELGHALALDQDEEPSQAAVVDGVEVQAVPESWTREYAADRDGLVRYLRLLAAQDRAPISALVGAELFCQAAAMLQDSAAASPTHPPPDERMDRLRRQYLETMGEAALESAGPAQAVRAILERFRPAVTQSVATRRERVTATLGSELTDYLAEVAGLDQDQQRAWARQVSRHLLESPGATLDFLHHHVTAPRDAAEPDGGSPTRLLAVNAALHLEPSLREDVGLGALGLA